jgi:hypothetical protein
MLHACVERFDVMGGRENILGWDGEVNKACVDGMWRQLVITSGTICMQN